MQENNQENLGDVVFIDAYNLMYRAYHATPALSAPDGTPTNAIYTLLKILLSIQKTHKNNIRFGMAVFDGSNNNFRKELDPEYKANRSEMPEDLKLQIPYIEELFEIMGWKCIKPTEVEADDWIASVACRSSKKFKTYIYSSDKDFYAIVGDNLSVVDGKEKKIYDRQGVFDKLGVYPENVVGYLSLVGDGVDNVKGIEKCGPKTAVNLLTQYGSIDGVVENAANIKGVVGNNLREAIENGKLDLYRSLIQMRVDMDIPLVAKDIRKEGIHQQRFNDFCRALNFESFFPENRASYNSPSRRM